ncbi:MAG: D-alanyl-D-alanine carboxypeptidase [Beijerinckiaceae bacterium]|nr:D-alanyl-D-alanine carboxypeptidase [Beijerinckiaceae bacterium]
MRAFFGHGGGRSSGAVSKAFSKGAIAVMAACFLLGSMENAEARRHHGYKRYAAHHASRSTYSPPYAEIVYDVNAGKVLSAVNPDAPRHPASITKVMTLYLLFEQLERGKIALDTELEVSAHAAAQAPSKLGLRPGSTIEVEDAIKAIVTKSANDVAVTIGENIAGSEGAFAELMTRKARAIGMKNTLFRNASGLPDAEQVTTARDLATLGRAIQDRFPKYYRYFSTRSFAFRGYSIGNHNRLLGRVEGVDGIKTGYTRASGFNLLTSAKLDGHHVIAVVLGGRSGRERDNKVAALIEEHMPNSYAGARRNVQIADADTDDAPVAAVAQPQRKEAVAAPVVIKPAERPKPAVVAELTRAEPAAPARAEPAKVDARAALPASAAKQNVSGATTIRVGAVPPVTAGVTPAGPALRWVRGSQPKGLADADPRVGQPTDPAARRALGLRAEAEIEGDGGLTTASIQQKPFATIREPEAPAAVKPVAAAAKTEAAKPEPSKAETAKAAPVRTGWVIQVAATDDEAKALAILSDTKAKNRSLLGRAESFTEKVQKGGSTLYRARFAGFGDGEAEVACKALKRSGYACFAQHI